MRAMDAFWKSKSLACGTGFFTEPNLCFATLNNQARRPVVASRGGAARSRGM